MADRGTAISAWVGSGTAATVYNTRSAKFPFGRIFGGFKFGGLAAYPPNRQIKFPANISGYTLFCECRLALVQASEPT